MKKPVIGITAVTAFNDRLHAQRITYPNAVWAAGGEAVSFLATQIKIMWNRL